MGVSHMDARHGSGKKNPENMFSVRPLSSNKGFTGYGLKCDLAGAGACKLRSLGRKRAVICKHALFVFVVVVLFFMLDSLLLSIVSHIGLRKVSSAKTSKVAKGGNLKVGVKEYEAGHNNELVLYERLLSLASKDNSRNGQSKIWDKPYREDSKWKPCAGKQNKTSQVHCRKQSGFITVSANGGLNQQRVAVCNAVVVAVLLNASLVLPKFLYSSVWNDPSQFGDIFQEEYFINYMKDDLYIVKELPSHLKSLDIAAMGGQITDEDIMKESKPIYFIRKVLPLLQQNGVVHFLGFGNRLGFDPLPSNLQRIRCKCNFHALKFVPKIQDTGSLLVRRIRNYAPEWTNLDRQLLGKYVSRVSPAATNINSRISPKYLALHMRFEMDMVAYSLCYFGGGAAERRELQEYREIHFPRLVANAKNNSVSSENLRKSGKCPLTPEEEALVLSALGFDRRTYIYLAGSEIYGGKSRMLPFTRLFPNVVTKEDLLSPSELAPFRNFSSQLAALDFIACATADAFAMTDSGSQLSSLVSGYRVYHGRGHAPTLRPDKKTLARLLSRSRSMSWSNFADQVKKMIEDGQRVRPRRAGQSIYRQPRSEGCMCNVR